MDIPYYHVDAFTGEPFTGNSAGVCLLERWPHNNLLQLIAAENNLSETAFIIPDGNNFALRWFSPTVEIDLCGHATLASAYVLDLKGHVRSWPVHFDTKSGILSVTKENDLYFLDFPSRPAAPCPAPPELIKGLGTSPMETYKSRDFLAVLENEDQVAGLTPDFATLALLECLGIIVTAPGRHVDFVSRFFAPRAGLNEDPVTGSSHCTLIPFWSERIGKKSLIARQISRRGGQLICEDKQERVRIGGRAVLYQSGTIRFRSEQKS